MTLKELFNKTLIEKGEISIAVYDIVIILVILFFAFILSRILRRLFKIREEKHNLDPGQSHAILQIIKYVIWLSAIFISFNTVHIKLTLLLAGSAALLVGLGLGLQQIFQDFMSGVTILFEGNLKVGDIVEIQDEIIGKVKEIGLRTTKIETRDNIIMIIPNSKFVTDIVINWSHMAKLTRFRVEVGVAYGSDIKKVTRTLLHCAENQPQISLDPKPFVRFKDFGDSALEFQLFFWTTDTFSVEHIKSEIRYRINDAFSEQGIRIPFPQRDVHINP